MPRNQIVYDLAQSLCNPSSIVHKTVFAVANDGTVEWGCKIKTENKHPYFKYRLILSIIHN